MSMFRSLVSLLLVLVSVLLVSCGGPAAQTPPPTYTPEIITQLQVLSAPLETARDRMTELADYIEARDWVNIDNFIHGPLGEVRRDMSYVSRALLKKDRGEAANLSKSFFSHIERLDVAAKQQSDGQALPEFQQALQDLNTFLRLVPQPPETPEAA
ncbi:MAG: photosystem II protein PsbQ [Chloroflexaceae bacterium]|nr:photosystem II protein PsbQ [Chloroflexaceae bacterium]